ncbi:MAG: glutamate--tRNA ligase [Candidatus Methylomirabilia bacterium]
MSVRVRFAPSPTGPLHLGNARTALFTWLFARKHGGRSLLRIEDTDRHRSTPHWESAIVSDLAWLGLAWDEEIVRQSDRFDAYRSAAERLLAAGAAYLCFCTLEELEARRQEQLARGQPPRYDGRCRTIPGAEAAARRRAGEPAAVRFRMRADLLRVADLVKGEVRFRGDDLGDFIILRADGSPAYNLAAALDDSWMRITHVIRGEDHLANTPRQGVLIEALGFEPPRYAHLPLIHGGDGQPLSKRHGAVTVGEQREAGVLPEALVNYLALLGWSPPPGRGEVMELGMLSCLFSLERVSRSPARFDPDRLAWFNRQHLRRMPIDRLLAELGPGTIDDDLPRRTIEALRDEARSLVDLRNALDAVRTEPAPGTLDLTEADQRALMQLRGALVVISEDTEDYSQKVLAHAARGLRDERRVLMRAARLALLGKAQGLPVATLLRILGAERARRRVGNALKGCVAS